MRAFLLVDCNNFFVSCERVFNPRLIAQPVVVLSNNDGCIIARSNEVKAMGVPMGAPVFQWKDVLRKNKVNIFSSNFELYGDMSNRVMSLISESASDVEFYSIDEAFLHVFSCDLDRLLQLAHQLRKKIDRYTGIPVSIGIAPTKTLAKIANHIAKKKTKEGVYSLCDKEQRDIVLKQFPVEFIWGIGKQLTEKLKKINIHCASELLNVDAVLFRKKFSGMMEKIIYELRGVSCFSLEEIKPRKQIISSRSFGKKIYELSELKEAVSHYAAVACEKLREQGSTASGVCVFLKKQLTEEGASHAFAMYFPSPTENTGDIINVARETVEKIFEKGEGYRKAGVILLNLQSSSVVQYELLTKTKNAKDEYLMTVLDAVNNRYGRGTLFHLAEGTQRVWRAQSAKRSPCYTTRWDELVHVF